MTLLISDQTVRAQFSMNACINSVEYAFAAHGRGDVALLERRVISAKEGAKIHSMSAASAELGYLFSQVYSGTPKGQDKNVTSISRRQKIFTLFDARTGACKAIIGGRYLSWLKTGAMGAVAIKHLSAPHASSLAVIGSGPQAQVALIGALEVRRLDDIRIWSRNRENAERLVGEFDSLPGIRAVGTVREAVSSAEIVVTVTASADPVLEGAWLPPGCHVNAIGAHYPDRRELDTAAIVSSTVFVDSATTVAAEKGELLIPIGESAFSLDKVRAELGQVVCGESGWRRDPDERTVFASCGSAIEALGSAIGAIGVVTSSRDHDLTDFEFS